MYTLEEAECHYFEERCSKSKFQKHEADNAQANQNVVRIVYGTRDLTMKLINKYYICLFHWTQSLDQHIKQFIALEFQDLHKALCYDYKKEKSL